MLKVVQDASTVIEYKMVIYEKVRQQIEDLPLFVLYMITKLTSTEVITWLLKMPIVSQA